MSSYNDIFDDQCGHSMTTFSSLVDPETMKQGYPLSSPYLDLDLKFLFSSQSWSMVSIWVVVKIKVPFGGPEIIGAVL